MEDIISKKIHKQMSENIVEIFGFLQNVKHPLTQDLLQLINTQDDINKLEHLITKITQVFSVCAFLQDNDLEVFRPDIENICNSNFLYKEFLAIYAQAIDIKDINSQLTGKQHLSATKRLDKFLYSF